MFPIPFNFPFRKKDGSISTIGNEIENGGSGGGSAYVLPTASAEVKGGVKIGAGLTMDGEVLKNTNPTPATPYVLPVASANALGGVKIGSGVNIDENGVISASGGSGISYGVYEVYISGYGIFKPDANVDNKYVVSAGMGKYDIASASSSSKTFSTEYYGINDVYLPDVFTVMEFANYITEGLISDMGLTLLNESIENQVSTIVLNDSIDDYESLLIQGCYNATGANNYDTTMIYVDPSVGIPYWFGVKDRSGTYSGFLTFTDDTHANLSASRRIKIYGVPKS